jgi:hypothetical protein
MRPKWIWVLLGVLPCSVFLFPNSLQAGNIGSPGASLTQGKFSAGPEFSGVLREIRDGDGIRYDTESWRFFLKGAYGITDWLEGFGRVGGATLQIRGTSFDSDPGIAGGAGLKITFLDIPGHPIRYSLGGQFFYQEPEDQDATAKWLEYDIWLGIAYREGKRITPYGGVVYSRVDGKLKNFPARPALDEFKSPNAVGIFFGVDWNIYEKFQLGIEGRLFGENSGTFSLFYRF